MPAPSRPLFTLWLHGLIGVRIVFTPLVSLGLFALVLRLLNADHWSTIFCLTVLPFLYFLWLLLFLLCCCADTALIDCFVKKPEICTRRGQVSGLRLVIGTHYMRAYFIAHLPLTQVLVGIPMVRNLVLRAYVPSTHLAPTCTISTLIADPDITYIGDQTIVGGNVELVAHSWARQPGGETVYKSVPIRIGNHVTIGGNARIELGVTIGDGALVEPASHVSAYTKIGPDEVWAGNPAVFVRRRKGAGDADDSVPAPTAAGSDNDEKVRSAIATALNVPVEKVTSETRMGDIAEWDSLGKIAIAASLHDKFGLELEPEQIFELDSVAHAMAVMEAREKATPAPQIPPHENPLPRHVELLPLGDPALTTSALANAPSRETSKTLRISMAATTVAEPVAPTLQLWCRAFGFQPEIAFAGFNQVQSCLLKPDSLFHQNRSGLNVVIVCPEDLVGANKGDMTVRAQQLLGAIEAFADKSPQPIWISDLPPMVFPDPSVTAAEVSSVRALWAERLSSLSKVRIWSFAEIVEELGRTASASHAADANLNTRYTAIVYQRLGIEIARAARQFHVPPRKVLALDADGTLWNGVVAEDGPGNVKVEPWQRQLQLRAKAFKEKGGLLALISRNEPEDVWKVWEHGKDMVLGKDDFAAVRINWKSKSDNLRTVAEELNLGLDSFVFVDDNPAERVEVEARCPDVLTIAAPTPGAEADLLGRLWCFDTLSVTSEDAGRTEMMRQESQRRDAAQGSETDYARYLEELKLEVEIRPAREDDLPRVAQLTQKTNQFNVSLHRRTLGEVEALRAAGDIWTISARDRFGDYGMIGVGILRRDGNGASPVILDTFLFSCRALGRGIELATLSSLCDSASKSGAASLLIPFAIGPRNQPVRDFLDQHGWKIIGPEIAELRLPASLETPAHLKVIKG